MQRGGQNEMWTGSSLNPAGCLSLKQVVGSFSAPITEEHAWAIVYETVKTLDLCLANPAIFSRLYAATSMEQVFLHQEGHAHDSTFIVDSDSSVFNHDRVPIVTENKALSGIGLVIFTALDYGLGEDQERSLSVDLEHLLDLLASEDNSREEDEGIENDEELIVRSELCKRVMSVCASHLAVASEAQTHYKAVCRALVSESLELSNFMEKVKRHETESDCKELQELGLQDWARLWRQILKDLRAGVKLKKVDYTKTPVEFELTPYEILMEDIRAKRFTLNKIMVDGELPPRIKKDAHDIILQFIRSRPPLKPASERQLQPARKESTPVELLMESIRNSNSRASLRKTGGPPKRPLMTRLNSNSSMERSRTRILDNEEDEEDIKASNRRKVTLDPGLLDDLLNFSDEDESEMEELSRQGSLDSIISQESHRSSKDDQESPKKRKGHQRRHSLTVCETPSNHDNNVDKRTKPPKLVFETQMSNMSNMTTSGSATPTSDPGTPKIGEEDEATRDNAESPSALLASDSIAQMQARLHAEFLQSSSLLSRKRPTTKKRRNKKTRKNSSLSTIQEKEEIEELAHIEAIEIEFVQFVLPWLKLVPANTLRYEDDKEHWATALQTLDLTLDEVVHIRTVLTKAELESLPLDGNLKEDVERGKVCFLCMKTRFGFFSRGFKCELCSRQVCGKCSTKMRIPLEHFSSIPVLSLGPQPVPEDSSLSIRERVTNMLYGHNEDSNVSRRYSMGSAPTSPAVQRKMAMEPQRPTTLMRPNLSACQMMSSSLTSFDQRAIDEEYDNVDVENSVGHEEENAAGPTSLPFVGRTSYFQRFSKTRLSHREKGAPTTPSSSSNEEGPLRQICMDCKEMVLQVVRAQSTARRLQFAKSLFTQQQLQGMIS